MIGGGRKESHRQRQLGDIEANGDIIFTEYKFSGGLS